MEAQVLIDGRLVPASEARVPVRNATFRHGEGVFETLRARGRRAFRLGQHLRRLRASAAVIGWDLPWTEGDLAAFVERVLEASGHVEARLRIQAGPGDGGLDGARGTPVLVMEASPFEPPGETAVAVSVAAPRRDPRAPLSRAKTCAYLENLLLRRAARAAGFFETIVLNQAGEVCEASMANVFTVRDGMLATPPEEAGALAGVTRGVVLELAARGDAGCVRVGPIPEESLRRSEEIFLTSTGIGVLPVVSLDGAPVGEGGPGPRTLRLARAYRQALDDELGPAR